MRDRKIVSIALTNGMMLKAPIFIDSSYEGDLMGQAGVKYAWGRESESEYGESVAGVRGRQRPDRHFNVRVSPFAADGTLLPEVQKECTFASVRSRFICEREDRYKRGTLNFVCQFSERALRSPASCLCRRARNRWKARPQSYEVDHGCRWPPR